MKPMRTAVIGIGRIARQHLTCLSKLDEADVRAVCDLSPAVAEAASERFGVAQWFTDYRDMLSSVQLDVVHVTTPAASHFTLALDALRAGAHVIVEKPITLCYDDFITLKGVAEQRVRVLIEDHNYLFNRPVQRIIEHIKCGKLGRVVHLDVLICLDILAQGSHFADRYLQHPSLAIPGGVISDFLTHLAYLCYAVIGRHESVETRWLKRERESPLPSDEFRAMVSGESATATLGFSGHAQPEGFWVRVYGTQMRAEANLFEGRLTLARTRSLPRPLTSVLNELRESRDVRRAALAAMWRKFSGGPGAYEGLWELIARTYRGLTEQKPPPISLDTIGEVNRLVFDLAQEESAH